MIIIAANGVFEIKKVYQGTFSVKLSDHKLDFMNLQHFNIPDQLNFPKIPETYLDELVNIDRFIMDKYNNAEVFSVIMYDRNKDKFSIEVPKQTVSQGSVSFEEITSTPDRFVVLDHHSHNTMGAFFSSVDDRNDNVPFKISMVIGKITDNSYDYKIRKVINGSFQEIDLLDIFDIPVKNSELSKQLQDAILKNVSIRKFDLNKHKSQEQYKTQSFKDLLPDTRDDLNDSVPINIDVELWPGNNFHVSGTYDEYTELDACVITPEANDLELDIITEAINSAYQSGVDLSSIRKLPDQYVQTAYCLLQGELNANDYYEY